MFKSKCNLRVDQLDTYSDVEKKLLSELYFSDPKACWFESDLAWLERLRLVYEKD